MIQGWRFITASISGSINFWFRFWGFTFKEVQGFRVQDLGSWYKVLGIMAGQGKASQGKVTPPTKDRFGARNHGKFSHMARSVIRPAPLISPHITQWRWNPSSKSRGPRNLKLWGLWSGSRSRQSARLPYLIWKIGIWRDWYRSQNGRDLRAKVKMCTPVQGLGNTRKSVYRSTHFHFCPSISSNLASVPISSDLLK
jgi:hypothetical protein